MTGAMRRLRAEWARLTGFRRRGEMEGRLDEEMRHHLELATARGIERGLAPDEARRRALLAFGGRERHREAARDEYRSRPLAELGQDLRVAARSLRRAPAFTVAAALTLALGIGATTVVFSVADHVVLRPLPYPDAERLFVARETIEEVLDRFPSVGANASHFLAWRERCTACSDLVAVRTNELTLRGQGDPHRVLVMRVSPGAFGMLGARAQAGRLFREDEDRPDGERPLVLSAAYWRRQFGADRDVIGRVFELAGQPARIVGVLDDDARIPSSRELGSFSSARDHHADLFVPLGLDARERTTPGEFDYGVIGRLAPGATLEQATAQLEAAQRDLSATHAFRMTFHAHVRPLHEQIVGDTRGALLLLLGAASALLLLVCVNLANLLLARNAGRLHESSVRVALGAGRWRLVRQSLVESLVLAVLGGVVGVVLSRWGLSALLRAAPPTLPRLAEIGLDARVLAVAILTSVVAGLVFGALPGLRLAGVEPGEVLKSQGGRSATGARSARRLRDLLVGMQAALSTVLLAATALFLTSLVRVLDVDKGFTANEVLAVDVALSDADYPSAERRALFYDQAIERLASLAGARAAGVATALPLEGEAQVDLLGFENDPRPIGQRPSAGIRWVSGSYFETVGLRVTRGRAFDATDRGRNVVVLSERAAHALWPDENPIGKRLMPGSNDPVAEVVGVAADVRTSSLEQEGTMMAYLPYWQNPPWSATLIVRTSGSAPSLAAPARAALRALGPGVPVSRVRTMEEIVTAAVAQRRFQLLVLALFAVTAVATACVGLHGVVAHSLARRTGEIGVRMALGARPADVKRLALREGLAPVAIGLVAGLAGAVILSRAARALLYGVDAGDATTLAAVAVILLAASAVACWLPARRAARMDVMRALRTE